MPPNYGVNLSVRSVTRFATAASRAPVRPAGYAGQLGLKEISMSHSKIEQKKIDKYTLFLRESYRPPSKGEMPMRCTLTC